LESLLAIPPDRLRKPSVADEVFDVLHRQVLSLALPPGSRLSEAEVAKALGVSRQPVRDAFYRLSKLGFLVIRPQRATLVSHISTSDVMRARFVREALEVAIVRQASAGLPAEALDWLTDNLIEQEHAVKAREPMLFHGLDDRFHRAICDYAGHLYAWEIIQEHKAHMDRVRVLSLSFALEEAFGGHREVFDGIRRRDTDAAVDAMSRHLSRIKQQILRIREEHRTYFEDEVEPSTGGLATLIGQIPQG
jgi:GntR family transcriptional regulator, rspAB operon transcriptional repressor